ncbi:tryptophan synthase subunit beta [Kluyvera sichuanensis]
MYYVQHNPQGQIIRVDNMPFPGADGQYSEATTEIRHWLESKETMAARLQQLQQSDLEMVRVLEDLIQVLIAKGTISITDLPVAAQQKLNNRANARQALGGLTQLLGNDDSIF